MGVPLIFYKWLFVLLFSGFVLATIAGTVLHECGHYVAGRLLGYNEQHISYAFTNMGNKPDGISQEQWQRDQFLFILGGPLETIIVGMVGLSLLCILYPNSANKQKIAPLQWLLIFCSLFWLRELFNFVLDAAIALSGNYDQSGDEFKIARHLHWNGWVLSGVLACIALVVLVIITYRFIPTRQLLTFLCAGLAGGIAGAVLWLVLLGPEVMP